MERLTDAGNLYLNDYQILNEARKEVDRYLNAVVDSVYEMLKSENYNFSTDLFKVNIRNNESSKGNLNMSLRYLKDGAILKKNKINFNITYKDIRHEDRIQPTECRIYLWSPVDTNLKNIISPLALEKLGKDIYNPTMLELDLSNSTNAAEAAKDIIVGIYEDIMLLTSEIE